MRWKFKTSPDGSPVDVELCEIKNNDFTFKVGREIVTLTSPHVEAFLIQAQNFQCCIEKWTSHQWRVIVENEVYSVEPSHLGSENIISVGNILSPMPGRILKVLVKSGDQVKPQQTLMIIEAMKMENEIRAPTQANIKEIKVKEGQSIEAGTILFSLTTL